MKQALAIDPTNPEVYSTNASVLLSQCRNDDARLYLEKSMDLWYKEPEEDKAVVVDSSWPIYSSRIALAKFLIEVSAFDRACAVIETCQAEQDEDPENWYMDYVILLGIYLVGAIIKWLLNQTRCQRNDKFCTRT